MWLWFGENKRSTFLHGARTVAACCLNGRCAVNNVCHVLYDQPGSTRWDMNCAFKCSNGIQARQSGLCGQRWKVSPDRVHLGGGGEGVMCRDTDIFVFPRCVTKILPLLLAMLRCRICSTLSAMSDMFWAMAWIRSTSPIGWILSHTHTKRERECLKIHQHQPSCNSLQVAVRRLQTQHNISFIAPLHSEVFVVFPPITAGAKWRKKC